MISRPVIKSVCDRLYLSNVSIILSVGKMKHDMWLCNNCDTETNKIYIKTGYGIIIRWWTGSRLAKYLSKTHSLKINQIKKTSQTFNTATRVLTVIMSPKGTNYYFCQPLASRQFSSSWRRRGNSRVNYSSWFVGESWSFII